MKIDYIDNFELKKIKEVDENIQNSNERKKQFIKNIKEYKAAANTYINKHSFNSLLDSNLVSFEVKEFIKSDTLRIHNIFKDNWDDITNLVIDYYKDANKPSSKFKDLSYRVIMINVMNLLAYMQIIKSIHEYPQQLQKYYLESYIPNARPQVYFEYTFKSLYCMVQYNKTNDHAHMCKAFTYFYIAELDLERYREEKLMQQAKGTASQAQNSGPLYTWITQQVEKYIKDNPTNPINGKYITKMSKHIFQNGYFEEAARTESSRCKYKPTRSKHEKYYKTYANYNLLTGNRTKQLTTTNKVLETLHQDVKNIVRTFL